VDQIRRDLDARRDSGNRSMGQTGGLRGAVGATSFPSTEKSIAKGDNVSALKSVMDDVRSEDASLWPSLGALLDELLSVLHNLSLNERFGSNEDGSRDTRLELRTALAMAARIKLVCSTSSNDRNIAISAADQKTTFRPEDLFAELQMYSSKFSKKAPVGLPSDALHNQPIGDNRSETSSINLKTLARFGTDEPYGTKGRNSGAQSSEEENDRAGPLQTIVRRVKMIESDFADDNIPERHLYLLRDLRMRVVELEKSLSDDLMAQRSLWANEKSSLLQKSEEHAELAEHLRKSHSESVATLRQRYEDALKNAEDALESSTRATSQEVGRLQEIIAQQSAQISDLRAQRANETAALNIHQQLPPAPPVPAHAPLHHPTSETPVSVQNNSVFVKNVSGPSAGATGLLDFYRMQQLVNQTGDHLDTTRQEVLNREAVHAHDVAELKSHFSRYKAAQAEIVRSLEDQLTDITDKYNELAFSAGKTVGTDASVAGDQLRETISRHALDESLVGGPDASVSMQLKSIPEAEDIVRKLEFRYRLKTSELDAVMRLVCLKCFKFLFENISESCFVYYK
jgi:hypothetical protein